MSSGGGAARAQVQASQIQAQAARENALMQQQIARETGQLQANAAVRAAEISSAGALGAAGMSAGATAYAANLSRESAQESLAEQRRQFDQATEDLAPYKELGEESLPAIRQAGTVQGLEARLSEIMSTSAFRELRAEGMEQASNILGQSGFRRSGRAAQAASDININTALGLDNTLYGRQMNNVNIGQAAAARSANAGQNFANAVTGINTNMANQVGNITMQGAAQQGQFLTAGANAAAQGHLNAANAIGGANNQAAYYAGQGIMGAANAQAQGLVGAANARAQASQNTTNTLLSIASVAAMFFSDEKLKKNIEPVGKVADLTLYEWDWQEFAKNAVGAEMSTGFKAQEVEQKYPDCVEHIGKFKAINYPRLYDQLQERIAA